MFNVKVPKWSMRQWIGVWLMAMPFILMFAFFWGWLGLAKTALIFGIAGAIIGCLHYGIEIFHDR